MIYKFLIFIFVLTWSTPAWAIKPYLAIMDWSVENRVAKFQDFNIEQDAMNHVALHLGNYPKAFVVPKPNDSFKSWLVDGVNKNVSISFPTPPPPPTDEERIDTAFPQTDVARVIFDTLFEMINRVRVLEGNAVITRAQFKDFLKAKLP